MAEGSVGAPTCFLWLDILNCCQRTYLTLLFLRTFLNLSKKGHYSCSAAKAIFSIANFYINFTDPSRSGWLNGFCRCQSRKWPYIP
jgi:hypothetical protein